MIGAQELLALKQRMLLGAEAAHRIAASSDQFVMYDHEQYQAVMTALLSMKADVRRLLAEHDILRSMFADRLSSFFMEEISNASGQADSEVVEAVPDTPAPQGGEQTRQDDAGAGVGVSPRRPPRKRAKRSKPRGDRGSDSEASVGVGRGDGAGEVDRD